MHFLCDPSAGASFDESPVVFCLCSRYQDLESGSRNKRIFDKLFNRDESGISRNNFGNEVEGWIYIRREIDREEINRRRDI